MGATVDMKSLLYSALIIPMHPHESGNPPWLRVRSGVQSSPAAPFSPKARMCLWRFAGASALIFHFAALHSGHLRARAFVCPIASLLEGSRACGRGAIVKGRGSSPTGMLE